jgi:formylglycine-generating enzyme required for sulfatase activity
MAEDITSNIKRISARHVLVVADSCYSGTLTRSTGVALGKKGERGSFLAKMMERPSRTLMASGGNEPVADAGGRGNHSVFASAFLTALREAEKNAFTAEELFHGRVKAIVAGRSEQVPQYSDLRNSGHEGGDFIFQLAQAGGGEAETATDAGSYETPANPPQAPLGKGGSYEVAPVAAEGNDRGYTDPETGMEFVLVKGGCYQMGDTFGDGESDEKPVHEVCVDDFHIGKYEVTQGQWKNVRGNNPSHFGSCGDNCPVETVSWNDTQEFIRILNQRTGKTYRLLTEAEWEYAARSGGKREKYSGGDDLDSVAWYGSNSGRQTHPVGRKQPNGLGIYDMTGNVWEWVEDIYSGSAYSSHGRNNPIYIGSGAYRVDRGGSWFSGPEGVRAANRNYDDPGNRRNNLGVRLAKTK